MSAPDADFAFLAGGGEVAGLIATHDWCATALGPIRTWPDHLRMAVAMALRAPVPMALSIGPDGVILYNDRCIPIAGSRHPMTLGAQVLEAWPEVADFNANVLRTVLAGGSLSYRDQELTLMRNGVEEQVFLNLDFAPLVDAAGATFGVLILLAETTEMVRAGRALLDDRERLRQMFEQAPSFMALLRGPDHVFELANAAYKQLVGHRDILGMPVRAALPDISGQGYFDLLDGVFRDGAPFVCRGAAVSIQPRPGWPVESRMIDFLYQPLRDAAGDVVGIFVEGIDITERTFSERAHRERDEEFRALAEAMPNHVWAATLDGAVEWGNSRVVAYSGLRAEEVLGSGWAKMVHPDDLPETQERWARSVATGAPYEVEFRLRRADGAYRWHLARAALIRDVAGGPRRWVGANTDIDDQKRTEQALRDSELRLRLSQEVAGIASIEVDIATSRVFGTDQLWALWGLSPRESEEAAVLEQLVVPADSEVRSSEASRRSGTAAREVEYRIRRADTGEERWIARHVEFVRDASGTPVKMFGVLRDVTEERQADLRQSILTHELEHRIKNILATVSAIASQTLRDTDLETARQVFGQRLQALAAAHDLLTRARWTSASLRTVVTSALEPFRSERISLDGPDLAIGPRRALALTLAVNELGTNALKYGALATGDGRVEMRWERRVDAEGAPRLAWRWREYGGARVVPPTRRGFGRFLLERVLASDFNGSVRIDFAPEGVECSLDAPWPGPADESGEVS